MKFTPCTFLAIESCVGCYYFIKAKVLQQIPSKQHAGFHSRVDTWPSH